MKYFLAVMLSGLLLISCNREKHCSEAEQRIDGQVLNITGPDSLQIGKTVPLLVEVEVNDTFCVKKAEGVVVSNLGSYVQVGARLVHTGYRKDNDCGCTNDKSVYTMIYFTPNVPGVYVFDTKPPSPIVNLGSDSSGHRITVH